MQTASDLARSIKAEVKNLEKQVELVKALRLASRTEGGHLTEFGSHFCDLCLTHGIRVSVVAKIVDMSYSAISQRKKQAG